MDETELGHAKQQQFEVALRTATNYNIDQLELLAAVSTGLCQERGTISVTV
jgi:hypothetical protein